LRAFGFVLNLTWLKGLAIKHDTAARKLTDARIELQMRLLRFLQRKNDLRSMSRKEVLNKNQLIK